MKALILFSVLGMFLLISVSAVSFTPQGDIDLRKVYDIINGTNADFGGTLQADLINSTNINSSNVNVSGNVVAGVYYGDGSKLTGIATGGVNTTEFWDDLNLPNGTQMEQSGDQLNIKRSWLDGIYYLKTLIDALFNSVYTAMSNNDSAIRGEYAVADISNKTEIYNTADSNYTNLTDFVVSQAGDNSSWNQTHASSIYSSHGSVINNMSNITGFIVDADNNLTSFVIDTESNFSSECSDGEYGDGSGACINFNDTVNQLTASVTYNASTIETIEGTHDDGNLESIKQIDLNWYNVSEDGGGSPLLVEINFTGVDTFSNVLIRMMYDGGLGHEITIQTWNFEDIVWENHGEITDQSTMTEIVIDVLDSSDHVSGGIVSLRFDHVQNGNSGHDLHIDYVALQEGFTSITTSKHDGLLGRDSCSTNHPGALCVDGSIRNATDLNVTGTFWVGDGRLNGNIIIDWITNTVSDLVNYFTKSEINSMMISNKTEIYNTADSNYSAIYTDIDSVMSGNRSAIESDVYGAMAGNESKWSNNTYYDQSLNISDSVTFATINSTVNIQTDGWYYFGSGYLYDNGTATIIGRSA